MSVENKILIRMLEKESYDKYRQAVKVSDVVSPWLKTVDTWFDTHDTSITVDELYELHKARFPVATASHKAVIDTYYQTLKDTPVNGEVVDELLKLHKFQDACLTWAEKLAELSSGRTQSFDDILAEMSSYTVAKESQYAIEDITADQMLEASVAQGKWKFNVPIFAEKIGGVGPGVFFLYAARPNAGKTLACIHSCYAPGGWLSQGAKILYIGNEEPIHRTKHRAICSYFGVDYKTTKQDTNKFKELVETFNVEHKDKALFMHAIGLPYRELGKIIEEHLPDIVIVDQIDKLYVSGVDIPTHEKMRQIYTNTRECAVKYSCAIGGVSQASDAATGKKFFGFEALENSKTGKGAELDLCMCIGMENLDNDNNIRYFKLAKNKLTGDESTGSFMVNKEQSRILA